MTSSLGVNSSYVHTLDNVLLNNIGKGKNLRKRHFSKRRKVRKNADNSTKVSVNQSLNDLINDVSTDIYNKILAINNIKSLLEKTNNSKKVDFSDKFSKNVQDFIKYGKIENSDDPLSIFFESLARETYHLLFLVVVLGNKVEEEDKNILKEELLNTLDVKFKDEERLEVIQFFDEEKLIKFLDHLTLHNPNTNGVCEITELLAEFKSKISYREEKNNVTSTSDSMSSRKLVFTTSTTEIFTESLTTEKKQLTTEKPTNLKGKPHKNDTTKENTYRGIYYGSVITIEIVVSLIIFLIHSIFMENPDWWLIWYN